MELRNIKRISHYSLMIGFIILRFNKYPIYVIDKYDYKCKTRGMRPGLRI